MKIKKILALMAAGTMLMTMGGCNAITIDGEENVREGSWSSPGWQNCQ